jgi:hypothetical protein
MAESISYAVFIDAMADIEIASPRPFMLSPLKGVDVLADRLLWRQSRGKSTANQRPSANRGLGGAGLDRARLLHS